MFDKEQVNKLFYGQLKGRVQQGADYRWSLRKETLAAAREEMRYQNTPLARIARYYLACVGPMVASASSGLAWVCATFSR